MPVCCHSRVTSAWILLSHSIMLLLYTLHFHLILLKGNSSENWLQFHFEISETPLKYIYFSICLRKHHCEKCRWNILLFYGSWKIKWYRKLIFINTVRDRSYHLKITQIRNTCIRNILLPLKTNMSKLTVLQLHVTWYDWKVITF